MLVLGVGGGGGGAAIKDTHSVMRDLIMGLFVQIWDLTRNLGSWQRPCGSLKHRMSTSQYGVLLLSCSTSHCDMTLYNVLKVTGNRRVGVGGEGYKRRYVLGDLQRLLM